MTLPPPGENPPVYVVFWRKRWHSGSARRYYTGRGYSENWRMARRYATKAEAEEARDRLRIVGYEYAVAEETRPLPTPDDLRQRRMFNGRAR